MRRASWFPLSLIGPLLHAACGTAALAQSAPDTVLVEVRIGAVASETMRARRVGTDVELPRGAVLALAELAPHPPPGVPDDPVSLDTVRALLHESVELDWTALTVTISDSRRLPVSRRLAREALHAAMHDSSLPTRAHARAPLAPTAPSLAYTLTAGADPRRDIGAALRFGFAALGGALEVGWTPRQPRGSARDAMSVAWMHPFDRGRVVRQLRIGDQVAVPITGSLHDAVMLSSAPPVHDATFGPVHFDGITTPGATVNVFSDGALAAWTTADASGAYSLPVNLVYGTNHLSVTTDEPTGGAQTLGTRDIIVAGEMLRAHTVQYTLASGRCAAAHCRASVTELRVAPFDRLTLGIAQAVQRDSAGYAFRAELDAWGRLADAVTVAVHATQYGATRVTASAGASPSASGSVALRWQSGHVEHAGADPLSGTASLDWLPVPTEPRIALHASGMFGTPARAVRARIALGVAGSAVGVEPFVRVRAGRATARDPVRVGASVITPGMDAGVFGFGVGMPIALHATIDDGARVLSVSLAAWSAISVDASVAWRPGVGRPATRLAVARRLAPGRYTTTVSRSDDASMDIRHVLDGSLVADLARARVHAVAGSGFGALRGRVFVDLDHDGLRGAGEPIVQGAALSVDGMRTESDARGEYVLWGLHPLLPLVVRVESLPAPYTVPRSALRVEVLPDGVTVLDVPVDGS